MSTELPRHTDDKLLKMEEQRNRAVAAGSVGLALLHYNEFIQLSCMHQGEPLMNTANADARFLGATGLATEAGEVLDQFKKAIWHKGERGEVFAQEREDKIMEETGDVAWYFFLLLAKSGWTLDQIIVANMDKLIARERSKMTAAANG